MSVEMFGLITPLPIASKTSDPNTTYLSSVPTTNWATT